MSSDTKGQEGGPKDSVRIIHATDLGAEEEIAFEHAVALACTTGGRLYSVHATAADAPELMAKMPDAEALLKRWATVGGRSDCQIGETFEFEPILHDCCVDPVDTLLDAVEGISPDLLVVGKHRVTGAEGFFHDSVAESLARNLDIPTLFVPIGTRGFVGKRSGRLSVDRVVIPAVDQTTLLESLAATRTLMERIGHPDVDYVCLHVGDDDGMDHPVVPESDPQVRWKPIKRTGGLGDAIADTVEETGADLVAMGTHGHDSLADVFRGSRTERIARLTTCPLLSIPLND